MTMEIRTRPDIVAEVEDLLAKTPRNLLFVIPHPRYKAALSRISTKPDADWSEFGHVGTVSPAWAETFAQSPELLRRLVEEVKWLRERFSVTCGNCGEHYLGPKDESLHGYNVCNMSRCED